MRQFAKRAQQIAKRLHYMDGKLNSIDLDTLVRNTQWPPTIVQVVSETEPSDGPAGTPEPYGKSADPIRKEPWTSRL